MVPDGTGPGVTALTRTFPELQDLTPRLWWLVALGALAIIGLPLVFAIVVVGGVVAVLLAVGSPGLALCLVAFTVPFGGSESLNFGDFNLSATEPLVVLAIIGWGIKAAREHSFKIEWTRLALPSGLFLLIMLLMLPQVRQQVSLLKDVLKWAEFLIIYLMAVNLIRNRTQVIAIVISLMAAGVAAAIQGVVQFVFQIGPEGFVYADDFLRAFGTFGQPNPYAGYLSIVALLPMAALFLRWRSGQWGKPEFVLLGVVGMLLFSVLLSLSRGAWLGLAVTMVILLSLVSRRGLALALAGVCIVVILGVSGVVDALPPEIGERFSGVLETFQVFDASEVDPTPENWAIVERMANWQSAWQMFLDYPILGIGAAQFSDAYPDYALPFWRYYPAPHAHNYFLNQLTETGVVGFVGYLWLSATALIMTIKAWRVIRARGDPPLAAWLPITPEAIAFGVIGMLFYVHAHGFFDNLYVHGITAQLGLGIGLVQALRRW